MALATRHVPSLITGTSHTDRVSGNADLGLTYHFTRSLECFGQVPLA